MVKARYLLQSARTLRTESRIDSSGLDANILIATKAASRMSSAALDHNSKHF
jgi:hypothetical protein